MTSPSKIFAFDLYGTLLDTTSISTALAKHLEADSQDAALSHKITADWRRYQLEYTWRLNNMGEYDPFSTVTHASLTHALTQHLPAYKPSATTITSLLATYNTLTPFPGIEATLSTLTQDPAFSWVIFSNGCHAMLSATIANSQMLRGARCVSVDDVKKFKPDPETYRYLLEQLGREEDPASVVLVSGNPFDVVGAGKVGLETVWVSGGADWCDGLGRPRRVVVGLEEIVDGVKSWWN